MYKKVQIPSLLSSPINNFSIIMMDVLTNINRNCFFFKKKKRQYIKCLREKGVYDIRPSQSFSWPCLCRLPILMISTNKMGGLPPLLRGPWLHTTWNWMPQLFRRIEELQLHLYVYVCVQEKLNPSFVGPGLYLGSILMVPILWEQQQQKKKKKKKRKKEAMQLTCMGEYGTQSQNFHFHFLFSFPPNYFK